MKFKVGDLVYCKRLENHGYLRRSYDMSYPLVLSDGYFLLETYTTLGQRLVGGDCELIKIPKTFLFRKMYGDNIMDR